MHGVHDRNDVHIGREWDTLYQKKYMEYVAQYGLKYENQVKAAAQAFRNACDIILKRFKLEFAELDKILHRHSRVINLMNK
jgi:hypothetical protein